MNQDDVKVFTLRATCKKCGSAFEYTRTKNLMGAERSVCDPCRALKGAGRRLSPRWKRVVSET